MSEDDSEEPLGPEPNSATVEAGTVSLEHAVFVALGGLAMVAVFVRIAQIAIGG